MPITQRTGIFYGWIILGASVFIIIATQGVPFSFGVFLKHLEDEFLLSRAAVSLAPALSGFVHGFSVLFTGWFTDRHGPKVIVIIGGLSIGLGLLLTSRAAAMWQMLLAYGLLVGFGTACSYVPLATTASRWFEKRRGLALGILTSGIGLGTVVMPPLARHLISAQGWRTAYVVIGCAVALVVVAAGLLLRKQPEDVGQRPYGETVAQGDTRGSADFEGFTLSEALRTKALWLLVVSLGLFTTALMMVMYHLVVYAEEDIGISEMTAATFLSIIGGANILGRLVIGGISDRLGRKRLFVLCLLVLGATMVWLTGLRSIWTFYLFAATFGFAYGGVGPMIPAVTGELFGLRHMGSIFGLAILVTSFGGAIGPTVAGYVRDVTGSYSTAFFLGAGAMFAAAVGVFCLKAPKAPASCTYS